MQHGIKAQVRFALRMKRAQGRVEFVDGAKSPRFASFFLDPSGNALEFKAFQDIEAQLFAV